MSLSPLKSRELRETHFSRTNKKMHSNYLNFSKQFKSVVEIETIVLYRQFITAMERIEKKIYSVG